MTRRPIRPLPLPHAYARDRMLARAIVGLLLIVALAFMRVSTQAAHVDEQREARVERREMHAHGHWGKP